MSDAAPIKGLTDVRATVVARVTIEIAFPRPFGSDWKLGDVRKDAERDAREAAARMVAAVRDARASVVEVDPNLVIKLEAKV